jgi:hypothetical protein
MIRAIIDGSDVFRAKLRFRVFYNPLPYQGTRSATECTRPAEFLQQTVPRPVSISTIRQILNRIVRF